jgi:drug/metabolite transporter (DMT)-like permease
MTSVRWIVAGSLLVGVERLRGVPLPPRSSWRSLAVVGILLIGFGNGAVVWAEQVVPSGLTAVLVAVTPFWMIGIERRLPGAKPLSARHIMGLVLGFCGVAFLVWPQLRADSSSAFLLGVGATQFACAGWAAGSNYAHRMAPAGSLLGGSALQMIAGGLFLLVVALIRGEWVTEPISARSFEAVCYLVFVGSMVGFSAYAYALQHLPLSLVSLYAYINPIIAVALGSIILQEPITLRLIAASAMVLTGIAIVKRQPHEAVPDASGIPLRRERG